MYVSCMSWCMWCVRGGLTGRSREDKSNCKFKLPLYSSSFSSLSSALSIPNSNCSSATYGYFLHINTIKSRFMRHMTNFTISPSPRRVFPKVRTWLAQELMRSQKLDANKDPMDPLEQVAILVNHPYLQRSLSFAMEYSFIMETTSISHILRQVSLEPFVTGMSVVASQSSMTSSYPWPSCMTVWTHKENHIGSQGNTDTDTDTDRHRHTV